MDTADSLIERYPACALRMDAKMLKEKLAGATLVLQDEEPLESYHFHFADDGVGATLGMQNGPVCAPLLHYEVTDDAKVQISNRGSISITWEEVELSDETMTVRCGSQIKRFTFTPGGRRMRYLP